MSFTSEGVCKILCIYTKHSSLKIIILLVSSTEMEIFFFFHHNINLYIFLILCLGLTLSVNYIPEGTEEGIVILLPGNRCTIWWMDVPSVYWLSYNISASNLIHTECHLSKWIMYSLLWCHFLLQVISLPVTLSVHLC